MTNFLRLRRTPKLAVPKHDTDIFFVDQDGVFKKMAPDGTVLEVGGGGGSTVLDGFAVHTQQELPLGNSGTWLPDTLDFASDNWTVDLEAGTFDVNTDDAALYLIQAQLVYRIVSNGPADNVWADITINQTTWNVDPLSFDCINSPGGIGAAYWRGSIAAAVPLGGAGGCQLKMLSLFHPFDTDITGAVEAQTFLRVFKIGDDPSFA